MEDQVLQADTRADAEIVTTQSVIWVKKFRKRICVFKKKCWVFDGAVRLVEDRRNLIFEAEFEKRRIRIPLSVRCVSLALPKIFAVKICLAKVKVDGRRIQFDILVKASADLPIIGQKCKDIYKQRVSIGRVNIAEVQKLGIDGDTADSDNYLYFEEDLDLDDLAELNAQMEQF